MRILRTVDANTYVVLTSDNGLHLGQLGLLRGKGTAYDTDTHVPVLVVGPGVVPGPRTTMVSNIDWAPTFEQLAGLGSPAYRSGTSLVPTFADPAARVGDYVFFEHTFSKSRPGADPDRAFTGGGLNVIPSYVAVRSRTALLVRNDLDRRWGHHRYAYELYDYTDHALGADQRVRRPGARRRGRHADGQARPVGRVRRPAGCGPGARRVPLADAGGAARLSACRERRRGRPPRLLHVEPRAPRRRGHGHAARRRAARRGVGGRGAGATRTSSCRPGRARPPTRTTSRSASASSAPGPCPCSASASACRAW